jgi:hypothetical protein
MSDLINRQDAIELIKNYCENGCDIAEDNWCPSCQREQFIELLKALPSAQQWIPCSERLPEDKEEIYWVCTDTWYQCQCRWTNNPYGLGSLDRYSWHFLDISQYSKVVAWMPLPELYEEE